MCLLVTDEGLTIHTFFPKEKMKKQENITLFPCFPYRPKSLFQLTNLSALFNICHLFPRLHIQFKRKCVYSALCQDSTVALAESKLSQLGVTTILCRTWPRTLRELLLPPSPKLKLTASWRKPALVPMATSIT